jgi:hypothetical protein
MATGTLLANEGDVQIGDETGIVLAQPRRINSVAGGGKGWAINNFNPLVTPEMNVSDVAYMHRPGLNSGYDIFLSRRLEFDVMFTGMVNRITVSRNLSKAMRIRNKNDEAELAFMLYGKKFVLFGRYRGLDATPEYFGRNSMRWRVRFMANDPAIYEVDTVTQTMNKYQGSVTVSGGLPVTTGTTSGDTVVPFNGDMPTRFYMQMTSPFINPCVMVQSTGQMIWLNGNGAGNVGNNLANTTWTIDNIDRQILNLPYTNANAANISNLLGSPSAWFTVYPTDTSALIFKFLPHVRMSTTQSTFTFSDYTQTSLTMVKRYGWLYLG